MSVKISVIVPVYNVEQYIEESLRSICEQNFEDYEIILVNDGTKDNSISVAKNILGRYSVSYTIVNKENGGLPSARNAGIRAANGEFVCFVDSDDIIAKNHLQDLWNCCQKYNVLVSYALFQLTYEPNRLGKPTSGIKSRIIPHDELLHDFLIRKIKIHCCALLVNKQYLVDNEIMFNEKQRYGEDIDFMWRLFPTLSAIGGTENETYMYLQRTNSLMTNQNLERVLVLMDEFHLTVDELIKKYPNDYGTLKYLYGKASLAFYRTFAESAKYDLFMELLHESNYKKTIVCLLGIGDFKIALLASSLLVSPKAFVHIVKKNRETVGE